MAKISAFDAAEYLNTQETIADYLAGAVATNDPDYLTTARETVERARIMHHLPSLTDQN